MSGGSGNFVRGHHSQAGVNESPTRPGHLERQALAARRFRKNVRETFATVGERAEIELPVAMQSVERPGRKVASLRRTQGAFKFIKSNEDAHPLRLRAPGKAEKT
jgi:hypothetical protein